MTGISDHYQRLGVSPNATREQIRVAYRDLARQHHPDARGDASAARMAQINEAWRVLSDPGRRAVYDAQLGRAAGSNGPAMHAWAAEQRRAARAADDGDEPWAPQAPVTPARIPWRSGLVVAALGITFVLVNAALTEPSTPAAPDNLIGAGSCVDFADNGDAIEVPCDGTNAGVVVSFRETDQVCPPDTEEHRDRQGMGQVCVRLTVTGG